MSGTNMPFSPYLTVLRPIFLEITSHAFNSVADWILAEIHQPARLDYYTVKSYD